MFALCDKVGQSIITVGMLGLKATYKYAVKLIHIIIHLHKQYTLAASQAFDKNGRERGYTWADSLHLVV